jgi:hypothetical protein
VYPIRKDPDKKSSSASTCICVSHTHTDTHTHTHTPLFHWIYNIYWIKYPMKAVLQSQHYEKRGVFNFSIVNFPYPCINIPLAYDVYISQMVRYARACPTYDQFLIRGNLLTNKLRSQEFLKSHLQTAFHKLYSRYNDLVCPYNLHLECMLSDVFHFNL